MGLLDDLLPDRGRPGILVARLDVPRERTGAERLEAFGRLRELPLVMPAREPEPRVPLHTVGQEPVGQRPRRSLHCLRLGSRGPKVTTRSQLKSSQIPEIQLAPPTEQKPASMQVNRFVRDFRAES